MKRTIIMILIACLVSLLIAQHQGSLEFAKKLYKDKYYQEAKLEFEKIIANHPTSNEAEESYYLLAQMYQSSEQFKEAEECYRILYESFPSGRFREQALFNWAESQYKQGKYLQSLETYNSFIKTFPTSSDNLEALHYLIDCHFQLTNYSRVLSIGQDFIESNSTHIRVPDVLLLIAKSYLKLNKQNDGENTLDKIIQRHAKADARWESVILKAELQRQQLGLKTAIKELNKQLELPDIPRKYEENLRKQLTDYFIEDEQLPQALEHLEVLITKFDRSGSIAEYLFLYSSLQTDNGHYESIPQYYIKLKKEIKKTPYYYDFLVKVAEAYYQLNDIEKSEEVLEEIKGLNQEGIEPELSINRYTPRYWESRTLEKKGGYYEALNIYQNLLPDIPAQNKLHYDILMQIGDIYLEKLQLYSTAISYYNQVVTGVNLSFNQTAQAFFKMALCYKELQDYRKSLSTIRQINRDFLATDKERETLSNLTELLRRYEIIDYEKTTSKLLFSLIDYLQADDKDTLNDELINIALYDLKDIETVIALLEKEHAPKSVYMKGKAYLEAAYRLLLEGRDPSQSLKLVEEVIGDLEKIAVSKPELQVYIRELHIEKEYLKNSRAITHELNTEIEAYLTSFPNSNANNRFRFLVGSYYLKDNIYSKADEYLKEVSLTNDIPINDFEDAVNKIGSYFFNDGQYDKALSYYQAIEQDVSKPENLYRYAVSLVKTDSFAKGIEMLQLLVNNVSDFQGLEDAISVLADHYRNREEYQKAVDTMLLLPEKVRDTDYYTQLSKDYIRLNNKQRAKESLMYITEKDNVVLRNLAKLHYETDDLLMAELTYQELIASEKDKEHQIEAYAMLAHINYLQENWQDATKNFEKVLDFIDNKTAIGGLSTVQIAQEAIVAYYRISNRPKAEAVLKKYKSVLDGELQALATIELNEGIYQMTINRTKADKSFSDIIKNKNYQESVKLEAYFWRGVNNLEIKKTDSAFKDFQQAAKSEDLNLRNKSLLKLGTISFSKEQFKQSLDYYYTVIQDDTTGELALNAAKNFAIVCKTIEEWQKAINAYHIILERGEEGKLEGETIFNIAYCHLRDRQYQEAVSMFERSITLSEDRELKAEAQYWIGESYAKLQLYEQAATEYLKVAFYYPDLIQWVAVSELKLSEVYVEQGRIPAAKTVLERIISKYGRDSDWGKEAVIKLQQL